jgi:hypothetical protein
MVDPKPSKKCKDGVKSKKQSKLDELQIKVGFKFYTLKFDYLFLEKLQIKVDIYLKGLKK